MEDMKKELYEDIFNLEDIGIIWNSGDLNARSINKFIYYDGSPSLPTYATTKTVIITTTTVVAANVSEVASTEFTPNLPNYSSQQGSEGTTHVLRDIKQELKQNIRTKAMTSLVRDNNIDDDNRGSKNDNR
ncbi:hypothetical protein C1646_759408 [Rhizophagus diaphanus]|nr:hypothetical protein C1646_759408 [Rhizophagus diaphanus] [Rhizophagus sp. MUCL 43196]